MVEPEALPPLERKGADGGDIIRTDAGLGDERNVPAGRPAAGSYINGEIDGLTVRQGNGIRGGVGGQRQGNARGRKVRFPVVHQIRDIDRAQPGGQVIAGGRNVRRLVAGNHNAVLAGSGLGVATVRRAPLADHRVVPHRNVIEDATRIGDRCGAGIAACAALGRHRVEDVIGIALARRGAWLTIAMMPANACTDAEVPAHT